jgi:glycolate oxidase FAD binding subunit
VSFLPGPALPDSLSIDGFGPLPVARPSSVAELGALVREADVAGRAVYPVGGGTMLDLGLPPTKPGTAIDLRGLDQVVDYPARDMTITVQAGITIGRLQEILRAEGQQLPVDVPLPDRATLGGAVATNASGPRRFGHGTLRDYVIGISVVNDAGQEVKGGGRVVKNVAGYDLMKLYTGSLGTLGIISQLTLKVKPRAEATAVVLVRCDEHSLNPLLTGVLARTRTRPTVTSVLNTAAAGRVGLPSGPFTVVIGYEEKRVAVDWQVETLKSELAPEQVAGMTVANGPDAETWVRTLTDFPLADGLGVSWKANLLPAETADFLLRADRLEPRPFLSAHAGNGIVCGHFPAETPVDRVRSGLGALLRLAHSASGNVVVTRCPSAWKATLPVWGNSTGDRKLMRAVKDKLDPRRVFNPGRFVDGI